MTVDLSQFARTLPYAAESFGIYQPLLGWRSKRITTRILRGLNADFDPVARAVAASLAPVMHVTLQGGDPREFVIDTLALAEPRLTRPAVLNANVDSFVARAILDDLRANGGDLTSDDLWAGLLARDRLADHLEQIRVDPVFHAHLIDRINSVPVQRNDLDELRTRTRDELILRESTVAGTLAQLAEQGRFDHLRAIFTAPPPRVDPAVTAEMARLIDPLDTFDPRTDLDRVALSPVGQVHLFRQYFFEFATFLGSPVQHLWLSPGSTLELVEVSTRKTTVEQIAESSFETTLKSEKSDTEQDELSDAVRSENQNNTKFGSSVSGGVSGGVTSPLYSATAHAEASATFGTEQNSKVAKEAAHKQMRTQSSKLTSEITKRFKTTFKTVSETTDVSSKRYVLANGGNRLVNYELRRKMRQVGVQVEDAGTQLCWQTYVDLPGSQLGLANLVHVGRPPDYANLREPVVAPAPAGVEKDLTLTLGFQGLGHDNDHGSHYVEDSPESETAHPDNGDVGDKIKVKYTGFKAPLVPDYTLADVVLVGVGENKLAAPRFYPHPDGTFDVQLREVNYAGDSVTLQLKLLYGPDAATLNAITAAHDADLKAYDQEKKRLAQVAMMDEARARVKAASNIQPRAFGDLREEERIIVYRALVSDLLDVGAIGDSPAVRHVLSELISSMFDVDRMLYFVAPDWWVPRKPANQQSLGGRPPRDVFTADDVVTWGSADTQGRKNYYITEDSAPARLGASIGWIMQLDGDMFRNAFLNAPWVKAVIPIRAGKELAALNWLEHAAVEGADALDARYQVTDQAEQDTKVAFLEAFPWPDAENQARYTDFAARIAADPATVFLTIRDALKYLALSIELANADQWKVRTEVVDGETVSYLPTEKVFEHGFDPLQGGFDAGGDVPYQVFSQWVEVLPTDQVVAVEVAYDPKTGQQIDVAPQA